MKDMVRFMKDIIGDALKSMRDELVSAACAPSYSTGLANVIGVIVKWMLFAIIGAAFLAFGMFMLLIAACIMLEFPVAVACTAGAVALLGIVVKLIRRSHQPMVTRAIEEHAN